MWTRLSAAAHSCAWATLLIGVAIAPADAQSRWDVAATGGLYAAHSPVKDNLNSYDDWVHTGEFALVAGRHLTRHLKIEIDALATGTGRQYVQRLVTVNGRAVPVSAEAETSFRALSASATWQFFDNEWVHPFVTAGVSGDAERRSVRVWDQYIYTGDSRVPGNQVQIAEALVEGTDHTVYVRPLIGGGVKLYFTERVFVRAEGRASLGVARQRLSLRGGLGVDF